MWRRQIYSGLAHGVKLINAYRFRDSYDSTDVMDYADADAIGDIPFAGMHLETRRTFWELGGFEDVIAAGRPAAESRVALLMCETTDIWAPSEVARQFAKAGLDKYPRYGTLGAERTSLFLLLQHAQLQTDIVIEEDAVDGWLSQYNVLFLADSHVSRAATKGIVSWVHSGGTLFVGAGGGGYDEYNRTNTAMLQLVGLKAVRLERDPRGLNGTIDFVKQHLPFARVIDTLVHLNASVDRSKAKEARVDVVGWKAHFRMSPVNHDVLARWKDGMEAVVRRSVQQGSAIYCGCMVGLAYFRTAIPKRPVDRGTTDDSFSHFIPPAKAFNVDVRDKLVVGAVFGDNERALAAAQRPVIASEPLVDAGAIVSPTGIAIPLVNWAGVKRLEGPLLLTLQPSLSEAHRWKTAQAATGANVTVLRREAGEATLLVLGELDAADAIVLKTDDSETDDVAVARHDQHRGSSVGRQPALCARGV